MKKEVKDLGNSSIQLDITVAKGDVKKAYDSVVKRYAKNVQIPGFRKGKVPVSVLENRFGDSLRMEAAYDIMEDALKEILENADKDIKPLRYDQPEPLGEIHLDPNSDFSFSLKYDVFPKIELEKVEGFTLKVPEVSDEEAALEEELKNIQRNNSFVIDRKEGETAQNADILTINYAELDDDNKLIEGSERQDFTFELGSGKNIYKFDEELVGMKKDEEKVIHKTYPDDFEDKDLAGKSKHIRVKLTALKFRDLPAIDDELAKDVSEKYKNLDDLKLDIKKRIAETVEASIKNAKIDEYLSAVIEANDFDLPQSMLKAELDSRWANMARQMGMTVEKLDQLMARDNASTKEQFLQTSKPDAEKALKKQLVIDALLTAKPEIKAEDADFEKRYAEMAEHSNMSLEDVKKAYDNENYREYIGDMIKQEKLFDLMIEKCKTEVGERITAKELLRRQGR